MPFLLNSFNSAKSWIEDQVSKRDTRDAARFALQSAVAAALTFSFMQAMGLPEKFVAVISAVLVVQPSVGGTAGEARQRLVATFFGSAVGILCLAILPRGFGTAAALAVAMLIMNTIAAYRPDWRYGVVAAVALSLGSAENTIDVANDRGIAIGLGVFIGMMSSFVIWPDSAGARARRYARSALQEICDRLDETLGQLFLEKPEKAQQSSDRFHEKLKNARDALPGMPPPTRRKQSDYFDAIECLYNSVLIIDRVEDSIGAELGNDNRIDRSAIEFCEQCRKIVDKITRGETNAEDAFDDLQRVRDQIHRGFDSEKSENLISKSALIFGLNETIKTLRDVSRKVESINNQQSIFDGLAYMAREAVPND